MTRRNAPLSDLEARDLLEDALARVSQDKGVLRTCALLEDALAHFRLQRRVAGAHGYGFRD